MFNKTKEKAPTVIKEDEVAESTIGQDLQSQDVNLPPALPNDQSPMAMMIQAKQAGFSVEEIKEMMDLQDRNDKRLAKQAFDKALGEFKREPLKVIKDKTNNQFDSTYVSIGNMVGTVNEAMGKHGLSARWEFPEPSKPELIKCSCVLSHELGYEVSVTLEGPIDASGAKNPMQARKSARTYLKLETFEAVTGTASEEGNNDDDGNNTAPPPTPPISEGQVNKIHSMLTEHKLDQEIFLGWIGRLIPGITAIENIPVTFFDRAIKKINATIDAQKDNAE